MTRRWTITFWTKRLAESKKIPIFMSAKGSRTGMLLPVNRVVAFIDLMQSNRYAKGCGWSQEYWRYLQGQLWFMQIYGKIPTFWMKKLRPRFKNRTEGGNPGDYKVGILASVGLQNDVSRVLMENVEHFKCFMRWDVFMSAGDECSRCNKQNKAPVSATLTSY